MFRFSNYLLLLLSGWVVLSAQPDSFKIPGMSIKTGFSFADIYREKNSFSKTNISFHNTYLVFSNIKSDWFYDLTINYQKPIVFTENTKEKTFFSLKQQRTDLEIGIGKRIGIYDYKIELGITNQNSVIETFYRLKMKLNLDRNLFKSTEFEFGSGFNPFIFAAGYDASSFVINNSNKNNYASACIELKLFDNYFFELKGLSSFNFSKEDSQSGYISNQKYLFSSVSSFIKHYSDKFEILLDMNYTQLDGDLTMYYAGNSFSDNSANKLNLTSIKLSVSNSDNEKLFNSIDVNWIKFNGAFTGNFQSWPFIDVLSSIIANRVYYKGNIKSNLFFSSTKFNLKYEKIGLMPAFSLISIIPEASVESWQPLFLIFGIKDYRKSELTIKNALLGHLSFNINYFSDGYKIDFSFGQLFPIHIWYKTKKTEGGGITGTSEKTKSDGGRWVSLNLFYNL